jgi:flagellar biosynthesis protein FlhG
VGGGRGGVGKSLVAVNLAVYFAQLGKAVVLVDADAGGSNLHTHFGLRAGRLASDPSEGGVEAMRAALAATSVPGLWLLPAAHDAVTPSFTLRAGRTIRWLSALKALPADYLVIDVGSGHGELAIDLMLAADVPIGRDHVSLLARRVPAPAAARARARQAEVNDAGARHRRHRRAARSH